jgi:hypothetical protein
MRLTLLVLAIVMSLAACSTTPLPAPLTDAERCARFGGKWSYDACRSF